MAIARLGHSRLNGRVWSCRSNPDAKREFGAASTEANARAAPATVSGEPLFKQPLPIHWGEGEQGHRPASQETCQTKNEKTGRRVRRHRRTRNDDKNTQGISHEYGHPFRRFRYVSGIRYHHTGWSRSGICPARRGP